MSCFTYIFLDDFFFKNLKILYKLCNVKLFDPGLTSLF